MERVDFLKYVYESINSDVKFAETKSTFLTTFNLAIIGASISFLFGDNDVIRSSDARVWFVCFVVVILISTFIALLSFLPLSSVWKCFRPKYDGNANFLFYYYNFSKYRNNFQVFCKDVIQELGGNELSNVEKQLAKQILDLSRIAYTKHKVFTIALLIEMISFPFLIGGVCC